MVTGIKSLNLSNVSQSDMDGLFQELLGEEKSLSTGIVKTALREAKKDAATFGERMKIGGAKAKTLRGVKQLFTAAVTATVSSGPHALLGRVRTRAHWPL